MPYLSKEKLKEIQKELESLKITKRIEIAERLAKAKEMGDLSENAEYSEARDAQALLERRIMELEQIIRDAEVVSKGKKADNIVVIGSEVKLKSGKQKKKYVIVGTEEADPEKGLISNESPIGRAVLGHKKGDEVAISTPAGIRKYTIINIK